MNSLRSLLRPAGSSSFRQSINVVARPTAQRTIVYLDGFNDEFHSEEKNPEFLVRDLRGAFERLAGEEKSLYQLPEYMLVQAFTHKSFRHGMHPYNERMAFYGQKLYKYQVMLEITGLETAEASTLQGSQSTPLTSSTAQRLLNSRELPFEFIYRNKCLNEIRWEPAQAMTPEEITKNPRRSGLLEVGAQTAFALIGLIALRHGSAQAGKFIKNRILHGDRPLAHEKYAEVLQQ